MFVIKTVSIQYSKLTLNNFKLSIFEQEWGKLRLKRSVECCRRKTFSAKLKNKLWTVIDIIEILNVIAMWPL